MPTYNVEYEQVTHTTYHVEANSPDFAVEIVALAIDAGVDDDLDKFESAGWFEFTRVEES